jgi:hypothetical protein
MNLRGGGNNMKKIIGILVCMLLVTTLLPITTIAGDEQNPELVDETNDLYGVFALKPKIYNFFTKLKIFDIKSFNFMDITSAWFYENPDKPDYLYSTIKLKNLEFINQRTIYAMHWEFKGKNYAVGVHVHSNGVTQGFFAGETFGIFDRYGPFHNAIGSFDLDNDIVIFEIPKNFIGNPEPGDILTRTDAWTGLRFIFEPLTIPLGGEVAKDWAGYGLDYTIIY